VLGREPPSLHPRARVGPTTGVVLSSASASPECATPPPTADRPVAGVASYVARSPNSRHFLFSPSFSIWICSTPLSWVRHLPPLRHLLPRHRRPPPSPVAAKTLPSCRPPTSRRSPLPTLPNLADSAPTPPLLVTAHHHHYPRPAASSPPCCRPPTAPPPQPALPDLFHSSPPQSILAQPASSANPVGGAAATRRSAHTPPPPSVHQPPPNLPLCPVAMEDPPTSKP
jgi:hypothetical protein